MRKVTVEVRRISHINGRRRVIHLSPKAKQECESCSGKGEIPEDDFIEKCDIICNGSGFHEK